MAKRNVLSLLAEYYVLRVQDLVEILRGDETARRSVQYTLTRLMASQHVGRRAFIDDMSDDQNFTYAYFLNESGAAVAESGRAFKPAEAYILRHEIEISQFHIKLKKWTGKHGLELDWQQMPVDHSKAVNPDAYFGIRDPKLPEGKNTFHYFLEIERSKIGNYRDGQPSIIRKLQKYYEFYDSDACKKQWGFDKFRVVLTVRNADRMYNLCARLPEEGLNHRMFWITTEPMFKESIGGEIFRTPRDFEKVAYSFLSK